MKTLESVFFICRLFLFVNWKGEKMKNVNCVRSNAWKMLCITFGNWIGKVS